MGLGLGGSPNQAPGFSAVICADEWAVFGGGQRAHKARSKAYHCWSDTRALMPPTQSPDSRTGARITPHPPHSTGKKLVTCITTIFWLRRE